MDMFKYCWYWEKPKGANFPAVKWQPLKVIEEIAIFSNGACTFAGEKLIISSLIRNVFL